MKVVVSLVLGIGVSLAAPPAVHDKDARPLVGDTQVEQWTKAWQKRLDLNDWRITTQIVRVWDLKPDTLGNLHWNSDTRTATIRVLNPVDYELPVTDVPQDIEYTIVHELVHLQLSVLPRDPSTKNIEERVVNKISEALFQLEKGESYHARSVSTHAAAKPRSSSEASRSAP